MLDVIEVDSNEELLRERDPGFLVTALTCNSNTLMNLHVAAKL